MNTTNHLEQIMQLEKITDMIILCQRYLDADNKTLNSEACSWLHELRRATQHRIEIRTRALARLKTYYAKKAFALAAVAYDEVQPISKN
jgi:hypothetical protein